MNELLYWLDLFGIVVFALSGALMAGRYKLDLFPPAEEAERDRLPRARAQLLEEP